MSWRHIPNILSVLRILMVPPAVVALATARYRTAFVLILAAGATDALDGYLARRFGWTSRLGSILDPLADKLLVMSAFVSLSWLGYVPVWLTGLVIGRDVVIVSGAVAYRKLFGAYDMTPTSFSKANSGLQIGYVLMVVAQLAGLSLPHWLEQTLLWLVVVTTLASGAHYVWLWGNKALSRPRGPS